MQHLELLFEIGCEELPARFVPGALDHLRARAATLPVELGLPIAGDVAVFGTPRRLCLSVVGLPSETLRSQKEVVGPALRAAYDASGQPSKACLGFAKSVGLAPEQLQKRTLPKGEYLVAVVDQGGEPTAQVLQRFLLETLSSMPLGKSMRWEGSGARFFRPIRWLVAVLGGNGPAHTIALEYAGLRASDSTRGHRFMAPGALVVGSRSEYSAKLSGSFVIADIADRRVAALNAARGAAAEAGGFLLFDPETTQQATDALAAQQFFHGLLEEVTNLCEWPVGVHGHFDAAALSLPRELLLTAMRQHQRYFAVCDRDGRLLPAFVSIAATRVSDPELVRRGNARVLKARLADASYFMTQDLSRPLASRVAELKSVVYHKKLGSSYAKSERALQLSWAVAQHLGLAQGEPQPLEQYLNAPALSKLGRAAALAKADLTTLTVGEFPELQGVIGAHLARAQGEDPEVASSIADHYRPRAAEDGLPESELGALVAIGDKLDTLVGIMAVGPMPTGSSDPFALRRNALGVVRILVEREWSLPLSDIVRAHAARFGSSIIAPEKVDAVVQRTVEYIAERFVQQQLSKETGRAATIVRAVAAVGLGDPLLASYRIQALQRFATGPDFEALCTTVTRVINILKDSPEGDVQPALLQDGPERALHTETLRISTLRSQEAQRPSVDVYLQQLRVVSELVPFVNAFFDGAMIMTDDLPVRANRQRLLRNVARLVSDLADFSLL